MWPEVAQSPLGILLPPAGKAQAQPAHPHSQWARQAAGRVGDGVNSLDLGRLLRGGSISGFLWGRSEG